MTNSPDQRPEIESPLKAAKRRRGLLLLRAAVSLSLLAMLAIFVDTGASFDAIAGANRWLLALLLGLFLLERVMVAFRWWMLLPRSHRTPFSAMLDVVMTSSFLGLFLPGTVGFDALRIAGVARTTRDMAVTLASFAAERFFALAAMFTLVLLGLALLPSLPAGAATLGVVAGIGLFFLFAGAVVVTADVARRWLAYRLGDLGLPTATAWLAKLQCRIEAYRDQPDLLVGAGALGIAFQFLRVLQGLVAGLAVELALGLGVWLAVMPLVMLALLVPISFFGLGLRDLSLVYMLGLFGVAAEQAFAVSVLLAVMTVLATLPGAWIFFRRGFAPAS